MNIYNSTKNQIEEARRCYTNALQCLADKRDANINFRLPKWMKKQIKESGKSEADFIIAKLGESMFKELEQNNDDWEAECKEMFG